MGVRFSQPQPIKNHTIRSIQRLKTSEIVQLDVDFVDFHVIRISRPGRLTVRTPPFHGENRGSIPLRDTNFKMQSWLEWIGTSLLRRFIWVQILSAVPI